MDKKLVRIDRTGRILIPSQFRRRMRVAPGSEVVVALDDGELRVFTREAAVRKAQAFLRNLKTPGTSVVDELIAERTQEAKRELKD